MTEPTFRISPEMALSELRRRRPPPRPDPLDHLDWRSWNRALAPQVFFTDDYAEHQVQAWEWLDQIGPGRPDPLEAIFPRGHAKSTLGEVAPIKLAARNLRGYFLYVSATQPMAEDHLGAIQAILETERVRKLYPHLANPKIGAHGNRKGYTQKRLWTPSLVVDAVGLDVGKRGAKVEEKRPDGLILDDIDKTNDTPEIVDRKIRTITRALIPALAPNAVIMLLNNLVTPHGIVGRLIDGRLDMLSGALRIGPLPALEGLKYHRTEDDKGRPVWRITDGRPTWSGFGIQQCEDTMNAAGEHAFVTECQQARSEVKGALLRRRDIDETRWTDVPPPFERVAVGVDPNKTGRADDAGIVAAGVAILGGQLHGFIIDDATQISDPEEWRDDAARLAIRNNASMIVVERTGLGKHAELTLKGSPLLVNRPLPIEPVEALLSKAERARPIAQLYRDGRIHHIGYQPKLEDQWCTWVPGRGKSPGAIDAAVHVLTRLMIDQTTGELWTPGEDYIKRHDNEQIDWSIRP